LRNAPDAPNHAEVEARIGEMQQQVQAQGANARQPTSPTSESAAPGRGAAPSARSGRSLLIAAGVTAAVGVALLATGGVFVGQTHAADDAVNRPAPGTPFSPALVDTLNRDQALEATFFTIGAAALITGAVVAVLGVRRLRRERALAWQPFGNGGAAGAVLVETW